MLAFFLGISFFIHVLSLAAIYLMYQEVQKSKNNQTKEIDQVMHSYLEQIQNENINLQESLHKRPHLGDTEQTQETKQVKDTKDPKDTSTPIDSEKEMDKQYDKETQYWDPVSLIQTNNGDRIETSLDSRVLQLHRSGVSADEIAKQLHCGKTEVSLIIRFQREK